MKSLVKNLLAGTLAAVLLSACSADETEIPADSSNATAKSTTSRFVIIPITPMGAHVAQMGSPERRQIAANLLQGFLIMRDYNTGVCYEVAAYLKYLYDNSITCEDLSLYNGELWLHRFNFLQGRQWDGQTALRAGEIIGFRYEHNQGFFHAAVGTGNDDEIRGVNGGRFGTGWQTPAHLKGLLGSPNPDGTFNYEGARIRVYLSNLGYEHQEL